MSLTADLLPPVPRRLSPGVEATASHRVEITADVDGLSGAWHAMLANGIATPYQNPDWVSAYARGVAAANGRPVLAVTVRDTSGQLLAVLPFEIVNRMGCRVAQMIGGKHANYQMPAMRSDFAMRVSMADWRSILATAAADSRAMDAFAIRNQPLTWAGIPNALAGLNARPAASHAYALGLDPSGEATLQRSLSAHARKKIRSKRNRFFELGHSHQWQALDDIQFERVLTVFMAQKAARFAAMGIPDPFAEPGMADFLRIAARTGAVELHALELDGEIVSCYVGAVHGRHFSGMATSFAPREDLARMSPGEILLIDLIHALCLRGFTKFDLGVGDARYKATICDETQTLHDALIPVTARGWLWCQATIQADRAKRAIKASPKAMALIGRLRRSQPNRISQAEA